jgi:hypothetical protein
MRARDTFGLEICNQDERKGPRVESIGGYLWLIITVIMVAALAVAILWGTHQWRQRRRGWRAERRSDEAVKRVYREEDSKT